MLRKLAFVLIICGFSLAVGCSGGTASDIAAPIDTGREQVSASASHLNWGLWQFIADPAAETLDVIPLREGDFHLNALVFLEPPALVYLSLETLQFNGNLIDADIGLRHPFLGLNEFTGFDVCGILITNGSYNGFGDPSIRFAGEGDTRLMNPDGWSRWWNPTEMPYNTSAPMFGYNDGLLGTPDSAGDFNCTINGYKYYCDDLDNPDAPMSDVNLANRGMFSAGQKNVRHYTIELGDEGLVFNYAVDACWQFPNGDPPWNAPDDFAPAANRVEPWYISVVENENTLYYDNGDSGGELDLTVFVYDWFNTDLNNLYLKIGFGLSELGPLSPSVNCTGYSTYDVQATDIYPTTSGDLDILLIAESEQENFQDFISGVNTSAYLIYRTTIADEAPTIPEDPVIIDENGCYGTVIGIDENDVIHTAYADEYNLFWSYSNNAGATWNNFDDVYTPTGDLAISVNSLSMDPGPDDGYVYLAWAERSTTSVHRALWAGRMSTDVASGPDFEAVKVWDHASGYPEQGYDSTQILALENGEFLIYSMFYYQSGGGFRPEYCRVPNFASLTGAPELEVNSYLTNCYLVYIYTGTTREMDHDSNGNAYFLNSGRFNDPGYNRGSFVLVNYAATGNWNLFESYTPLPDVYQVWYWDNRSNGLFIDDDDIIHLVSQWQTVDEPLVNPPADDEGIYTLIYAEGSVGGSLTWTNPIPDMQRYTPHAGAYTNARFDDEWVATSCVEDGNGLTYIVFQDCVNTRDAYYITWDGTSWNHTTDWVKINTTPDQYAYNPYAIRGLDGYIYVTYTDREGTEPGYPVFKAVKEE